jgi:hypothetical protein
MHCIQTLLVTKKLWLGLDPINARLKTMNYLYIISAALATSLSRINTLQNVMFVQQTTSLPPCGTSLT